jgi:hypothetical protein
MRPEATKLGLSVLRAAFLGPRQAQRVQTPGLGRVPGAKTRIFMAYRAKWGIMSWDDLASAVRSRRTELGLTQADVAAAGELSIELVNNIECNRRVGRRLQRRSERGLEAALRWPPGSVHTLLTGQPFSPPPARSRPDQVVTDSATASASSVTPTVVAPAPAAMEGLALARQVVMMRSVFWQHSQALGDEPRAALAQDLDASARDAEESLVRMLPLLHGPERSEAIDLLIKLRQPVSS